MNTEEVQRFYAVFGGETKQVGGSDIEDPNNLSVVGIFADYDQALSAWRSASQSDVDNARMRYFLSEVTPCIQTDNNWICPSRR